jgi:hypothetical protein
VGGGDGVARHGDLDVVGPIEEVVDSRVAVAAGLIDIGAGDGPVDVLGVRGRARATPVLMAGRSA